MNSKPPAAHSEGLVRGFEGIGLFHQTWLPEGEPRAAVALVHGIGEHSGRYAYMVERLIESGIAVCALDNRGHGRSEGPRGHINTWSEYREDLHLFMRYVLAKFPKMPVFLYGHSLGALIVTDYILFYPEGIDGLIVSGHPFRPTGAAKPILIKIARLLSRYLPETSLSLGLDDSTLSRDPAIVKAYGADKLVHRKVTARWGTEALAAVDRVRERASDIRVPFLVLHGAADKINSAEGSRELFEKASSPDKELIIYPGGFHEPHNDIDRERVLSDVIRWITQHLV